MDHPILYGRHASHLWDGQSAFQVLFQHLQKTELFFFNTNGENHRRYIILKEQRVSRNMHPIQEEEREVLTKYLRNISQAF